METVLQEAAVTDAVMASCFEEMDADHSGTIEWCAPSLLVPGLSALQLIRAVAPVAQGRVRQLL